MPTKIDDVITENEYLVREPQAEYKHEYRDGRMIAMSGASPPHVLITGNVHAEIRQQLKGRPCAAFASDMRVKVAAALFYTYPDVSVVCGEPKFDTKDKYALVNPLLIIEVLSPSTETYDRGEKFSYYQKLGSLQEYVLIRQDRASVTVFRRQDELWAGQKATQLDGTVEFASIGCRVLMREIYDKVDVS